MKVLLIEDEERAADYLRKGLSENGYVVDVAADGVNGLHKAIEGDHDLVILDAMLPRLDGFAVLAALRGSKDIPILMLTACARTDDKVRGFDLGADDYLVKPFQFPELLARMRALLKRGAHAQRGEVVRVADLELDPVRHQAVRAGRSVALTAREFALLQLFMRRCGEVLSRTEIASRVWDINFDSDTNVIDVAVARLRSKVDEPFAEKLIHTVRGVGYVLESRTGAG